MADFHKKHQKNTRFSVNRSIMLFFKVSVDEKRLWLKLVQVLNKRRNTGNQIETFLYLINKPVKSDDVFIEKNVPYSVDRKTGISFKLNSNEIQQWQKRLSAHGGSKVNAFVDMINAEYTFQDSIRIINENDLAA